MRDTAEAITLTIASKVAVPHGSRSQHGEDNPEGIASVARATWPRMPRSGGCTHVEYGVDHDVVAEFAEHAKESTPDQLTYCEEAFAMVARAVSRKEVRETPEAEAACRKEWERPQRIGCWDPESVAEWKSAKRQADKSGVAILTHRLIT